MTELLSGRPLSDLIPRGGLPLERPLAVAVTLMDAVSATYARGITHPDLKPANVMVTAEGQVKVLDFGLAKPSDAAGGAGRCSALRSTTTRGSPRLAGGVQRTRASARARHAAVPESASRAGIDSASSVPPHT